MKFLHIEGNNHTIEICSKDDISCELDILVLRNISSFKFPHNFSCREIKLFNPSKSLIQDLTKIKKFHQITDKKEQNKKFKYHLIYEEKYNDPEILSKPIEEQDLLQIGENDYLSIQGQFPPFIAPNILELELKNCSNISFHYLNNISKSFNSLTSISFSDCTICGTLLELSSTFFPKLTKLKINGTFISIKFLNTKYLIIENCPKVSLRPKNISSSLEQIVIKKSNLFSFSFPNSLQILEIEDCDIDDKFLKDYIFKEIKNVKQLKKLNLNSNRIETIPLEINELQELKELQIRDNLIKEIPNIGELINLESIDISNNQIQTLPSIMHYLTKLNELNIKGNPITNPPIQFTTNLNELKGYWKDLLIGQEKCNYLKLIIVCETYFIYKNYFF